MSSFTWWRSWHGAPTDHKWAVIANRAGVRVGIVSAVAWALLDYASQNDDRGSITGFDTETYAVFSGFDESEIVAVIQAMTDKGVITANGRLANWEKRQPQREDYSTPRVRKMRTMKHNVTQSNALSSPDKTRLDKTRLDKESDEEVNAICQNVFTIYEQEIGPLTPGIADKLKFAEAEYSMEWVTEAIHIASARSARNWSYVSAVLNNWKVNGYGSQKANKTNNKQNPAEPASWPALRQFMQEQGIEGDVIDGT